MSRKAFSHDLRDFRLESGLSRKLMAQILGVSDYTVRSWENGKQAPQTSTLWDVLGRLSSNDTSRKFGFLNLERLRNIVESYAKSVDLSPDERSQSKLRRIEQTLSGSVLKASQTDFRFDKDEAQLKTIPFHSDLSLFPQQT